MNTLTDAQRKALIDYTVDLTRRTMELALVLFDDASGATPLAQPNGTMHLAGTPLTMTAPGVPIAPRKRGRPRKHPLPTQG